MEKRTGGLDETRLLLDRARNGDEQAMERLFERYLPRLQRWARGRLPSWARDLADTHDLVQDTLLRTFKKIDGFEYRGEGALQAYLRQALMNRVREELRRRSRRPDHTELDEEQVDSAASPLEHAIGRQRIEAYEHALGRLKDEERELLIGRLELGLTYEELASLQDRPSSDAARKATERALARLIEEMTCG
jgi:RNA polymerase sigma-70 factor (ECF subfamily)